MKVVWLCLGVSWASEGVSGSVAVGVGGTVRSASDGSDSVVEKEVFRVDGCVFL